MRKYKDGSEKWRDEMRIEKMNNKISDFSKTTDTIFRDGKSEFYPKKEKSQGIKKMVDTVKNHIAKNQQKTVRR